MGIRAAGHQAGYVRGNGPHVRYMLGSSMQTSCDSPHCKSHHSGDPLIPLSPSGAPKPSKVGPNPELPAKTWRCLMGHCICRRKSQEITKWSERINEKRKVFKMQERGPERCSRKQIIPTRVIIPRVSVCCPVQGVCSVQGYPKMRQQGKVPQPPCLPTTLPSHCGLQGLIDLQSNPVPSNFNFREVISVLKAPLELRCFQKMFGLGAAGLQVPS